MIRFRAGVAVYIAESHLDPADLPEHDAEFVRDFASELAKPDLYWTLGGATFKWE